MKFYKKKSKRYKVFEIKHFKFVINYWFKKRVENFKKIKTSFKLSFFLKKKNT